MKRLVLTVLCLATLTACASPAVYAPATSPRGSGFSEQRIESDRVRVTFHGAGSDSLINDYALLRAADLTLQEGYEWFHVVGRTIDSNYSSGPHMSVGTGGTNYGHHSAVGVGIGTSFDLGPGPMRTVTLEVKFGHGPRPDDRDAYDAHSVSQSIRAHMAQPPAH